MLKKFIRIKNIGKFVDCKAAGDVEFRPLTLIFGENGRGKTTLCGVLRSVGSGDRSYLSERKTLGSSDDTEISILADDGTVDYKSNAWSAEMPNVVVFDSGFVHENVYAGDHVAHEHKKNLHRVIVGRQGVTLNQKIADLDAESRQLAKELRALKAEVEQFVPKGVTLDQFLACTKNPNVETDMAASETEIASLSKAAEIKAKAKVAEVTLPQVPNGYKELLKKTLEDVSADAESTLKTHLQQHTSGATEGWVSEGLENMADDVCPFCGRSTAGLELVTAYRNYFSDQYNAFKEEIAGMARLTDRAFGDAETQRIENVIQSNEGLVEFWEAFVDLQQRPEIIEEVDWQATVRSLGKLANADIDRKVEAPLESVTASEEFEQAEEKMLEVTQAVQQYNAAVVGANRLIEERKKLASGGNLTDKERELGLLQAAKARHEPEADAKCKEYQAAVKKKNDTEAAKGKAREKLDAYSKNIFANYKDRINELLGEFGASFQLGDISPQYVGGQASSTFDIVIKNQRVAVGDPADPRGQPRFGCTLSAGDRSTLALAFFLAQLEQDASYKDAVVIFDDPFTSQDRFRRTRTQQLISDKVRDCKQVVVMSHDPHFLKLIWDNHNSASTRTLQLSRVRRDEATIAEWDIEAATRSGYAQDYFNLQAYVHRSQGQPRDVARKIRPVLEGYLRVRFPSEFPEGQWLGQLIEKIRGASAGSPLESMHGQPLDELANINDFSKPFHHETNPSGYDAAVPNEDELATFCEKTIRYIGGF